MLGLLVEGASWSSWQPSAARHCKPAAETASPDWKAHIGLGFDQPYAAIRSSLQPCRARKFDQPEPSADTGSLLVRQITISIRDSNSLQDLEDIVHEYGSSFDYIHTAAAFVKAAKLGQRPANATGVAANLVRIWKRRYDESGAQGLANVLWASSKLQVKDSSLWSGTLQAFLQDSDGASFRQLANVVYALAVISVANKGVVPGLSKEQTQQSMTSLVEQAYILITHPALEGVSPLDLANILLGCAKLRFGIQGQAVTAFVKALARPDMVEAANAQALANSIYALSVLKKVCDLHSAINERLWGRILDTTVVDKIANSSSQHVSNTVLALACLATGAKPVINQSLAQECATQLLNGSVAAHVGLWNSQDSSNALYAYAKLQLKHRPFLDALVIALPNCIPTAKEDALTQIAWACASLGMPVHWMADVLSCSRQLSANTKISDISITGLVAVVSSSIAKLDMQQLADGVVGLVCTPAVKQRLARQISSSNVHFPAIAGNAGMLWHVHTWLVDKKLLDTTGLSRCMTPEQLAICQKSEEDYLSRLAGQ